MALTIASREVDGVTVLDLSGRITLGEGSVQLRDAIRDLISKGQKNILLNLGDVNYIDSSGLGELVSAYTTAKNQGASLKLLKLTKKVHDLLQLTKLYTVFDISDRHDSVTRSGPIECGAAVEARCDGEYFRLRGFRFGGKALAGVPLAAVLSSSISRARPFRGIDARRDCHSGADGDGPAGRVHPGDRLPCFPGGLVGIRRVRMQSLSVVRR